MTGNARSADFLFTNREELEGRPLVKMHSAVIKSRDGLDLVIYYSLPLDSDTQGVTISLTIQYRWCFSRTVDPVAAGLSGAMIPGTSGWPTVATL